MKTALAPKPASFFQIVLIFDFTRDEFKNFRKTVLGAPAQQNKGVCGFFLQVKFATSLLALLAGG